MILGCDVGTSLTKAVVLSEGKYFFGTAVSTKANADRAMEKVLDVIRKEHGLKVEDFREVVVTGWGEARVSLPHRAESTMKCIARAAVWDLPSCRFVLCLGAQQSSVLAVNDKGLVLDYQVNDKCAAGAGRFLEIIFEALETTPEDSADIARSADKKITISSQCAVFAESEVVSLVNDGVSVANILDAIFRSLVSGIVTLAKRIPIKGDIIIGGGLANNSRIIDLLEEALGRKVNVFRLGPTLIAAMGAALSANGG
jgi:(R)-2-hydroxyacyl-CoA dehydratese activating ATPase